MESIQNIISNEITKIVKNFKSEYSEFQTRLDLKRLTIYIDQPDRSIPLKRIGSAENWLAYHLSVMLAIHQFSKKNNRSIPQFLLLDQLSQVYFPPDDDVKENGEIDQIDSNDRTKVFELYEYILKYALDNKLQIILVDHANISRSELFQNAITEVWRNGNALIPESWLKA
jgi:hypothetical protein